MITGPTVSRAWRCRPKNRRLPFGSLEILSIPFLATRLYESPRGGYLTVSAEYISLLFSCISHKLSPNLSPSSSQLPFSAFRNMALSSLVFVRMLVPRSRSHHRHPSDLRRRVGESMASSRHRKVAPISTPKGRANLIAVMLTTSQE